ncbi:arabinosyltransferase domain-containing protein [Saccharomonospora sp. NB11]|uniref:arabinosyltransferase domain-containing protein n=1 Tax=Saccharomonospora sp. NB11 TaxID=1642298 RepID=UPI0018D18716|nr:arabinosyltransferase domain-containing protein [Saccharomonospora sp. NB11]
MDSITSPRPGLPEDLPRHSPRRSATPVPGRRVAAALGLVTVFCALVFPFLPVIQSSARIVWPVAGDTTAVNAPLVSYWALDTAATVPCATVRSLDARTSGSALLLATVPPARDDSGIGLRLTVQDGELVAVHRGEQVARTPLSGSDCSVAVHSTPHRTTLTVGTATVYEVDGDVRPRIVGIYSDLDGTRDPVDGLTVSITPDTRYESSPTAGKLAVAALGVVAALGCLTAVARRDRVLGRRAPPVRRRPRLTGRDAAVVGVLAAWVLIGPVTSDDGYILTMARVADEAGYLTNYHRWFGVAEAPFGWFYHVYTVMAQVSASVPWIRLPSFVLGVTSWLILSRHVLPRLGAAVRLSRAAGWAAATVFCVWWLPYDNGVRPEPVAVLGSLLSLWAVERALATRRLLPVCLGVGAAAFTVAATPTGLIAIAPFLVAARPLFRLLREHSRDSGTATLAPVFASGCLVLFAVFADQTAASVAEAIRVRDVVGPSMSWYEELARYELLFSQAPDGSLTRRFPVLLLVLCTAACLAVLLRRGRIPGAALGPSRRLIGTVALFFVLLALTPTKWTHHFGAFAAVGAAMAALTALATSGSVLRSRRNHAAFVAGLLLVAAVSVTAPNDYWFVSQVGVPWFDLPPEVGGVALSTVLTLAAAVAGVVAFSENVRARGTGPPTPQVHRLALWRGSVAIVAVCGFVVLFTVGSMVKAMVEQRGTYSLGTANLAHLTGSHCGLGDHVMVERDPANHVLSPLSTDPGSGTGFHTAPTSVTDPLDGPPHGFDADTVPMWSSHDARTPTTGRVDTPWHVLPADAGDDGAQDAPRVVVSVASPSGTATHVDVEFGRRTPDGVQALGTRTALAPGAGTGEWEDARLWAADVPADADAVRLVLVDDDLTTDGWVAATAPRAPTFTTLTEAVGDTPVYVDWPASFVYPCLTPTTIADGVLRLPGYHLTAGSLADEAGWASATAGGMLGNLDEVAAKPEIPSYLAGEVDQPWGALYAVEPYEAGDPPTIQRERDVRPGWWSPGPGPQP